MDGGMLFNFAMKVVVYKDFNIVFHVEGADANAAAVVGKELYGAMGLNFNVKPGYDFSMEAGYLVNNSSSTEVKVLSQLSLQF
jgi:hypothetical protein